MTGVIRKPWWNKEVKPLTGTYVISMSDIIIIMIVFVDFCQYLAIGPDFCFSSVIWDLSRAKFDLSVHVEMSEGVFWLMLDIVYVLWKAWFVVSILLLLKIDIRYENSSTCRNVEY
jgi:hypothetical protein